MMFSFTDYLKLGIGAIAGAALMAVPACSYGVHQERESAKVEAAKEALGRITKMEENDASFRKLPSHERCLAIVRDSGLPDSTCDER
ncbi:hypothetical protein SAMN05428983_0827 [Agrobacterium fabrum]|uniref:Uncharacterized protein n=1 Tax=Agrobacterium fabrum TaxID=1176649 RepID=A0A7Z7BHI3_9HYPH|nr:hypothetical protein [Agrobacterium fabrum]SDJ25191.1 hypothetical protein SAMN05428983_0827 [Agrobacterium fabrum]